MLHWSSEIVRRGAFGIGIPARKGVARTRQCWSIARLGIDSVKALTHRNPLGLNSICAIVVGIETLLELHIRLNARIDMSTIDKRSIQRRFHGIGQFFRSMNFDENRMIF